QERILVRLSTLRRGDTAACALPECDRAAGDLGGARRDGVDIGKSEPRHCGGRRNGLPPLPRNPAALSRPGDRDLYGLDALGGPARVVSGKYRSGRSVAIPQRAGGVTSSPAGP